MEMLNFLEGNGFPMTIHVETSEDISPEDNTMIYKSIITDAADNKLSEFNHTDLRARIHWVNGFFTALNLRNGI